MKVFSLLHALSPQEQKRFLKLLQSPYFNTDQKLVRLAEYLLNQAPEDCGREKLDAWLFPGQAFDYFRISNLLSYLYRHFRQFLIQEQLNQSPEDQHLLLLTSARRRELDKVFREERKKSRLPAGYHLLAEANYLYQFQLAEEAEAFFSQSGPREASQYLNQQSDSLHHFFVLGMLKIICQSLNQQNIIQGEGLNELQQSFVLYLDQHIALFQEEPFVALYHEILLTSDGAGKGSTLF